MNLTRYIPIAGWLPAYRPEWLRYDTVAGLTAAAVVIPQAMAMATVASLPVEVGLYTAVLPMAVYAMLGTSRPMSMSTTSTIALLTGAVVTEVVHAGDSAQMLTTIATLTLMVGVALLLGSVLKLGSIANFISDPVLIGFKIGLGFVIVLNQVPKLFGIHYAKAGVLRDLASLTRHLPETSMPTLIVGAATLVLIVALEKFWPHSPAPIFAVGGGIAAAWFLQLEKSGVAIVGNVPSGLPGFQLPGPLLLDQLWPAAIGIALMSFTETVAVGRAFASTDEPRPDADQELRAIGLANVAASMFHSMPVGGGTSQTAVNVRAGAKTQVSELVTVAVAVLTALFVSPLIGLMPQATLAALVIAYTVGLMSTKQLLLVRTIRHMEFWWGVSAALGVVFLGTLHGILVAVIISLAALVYETNRAPVYVLVRKPGTNVFRAQSQEHPGDESIPGMLAVRTEGRMYFANAQRVGDRIWRLIYELQPRVVVIDCSAIPDFEYTALRMLILAEEKLRTSGIELWLSGLTPVSLDVIRRSPLGQVLGRERMCFDMEQAVDRFRSLGTKTAHS